LLIVAAVLGAQACASDQSANSAGMLAAPGGMSSIGQPTPPPPVRAELTVCSFTQDGTYQLTVNGAPGASFFIAADDCTLVRTNTSSAAELVVVTQTSQSGVAVDSVVKTGLIGAVNSPGTVVSRVSGALSATTSLGNEYGVVVTYWNTF
jgi:hypothetical protein